MVRVAGLDGETPGFTTVIVAEPGVTTALAGTVAVNCWLLTKAVLRGDPFNCTPDPLKNPVPLTVSVNCGLPAVTAVGLMLLIVGWGVSIENAAELETTPAATTATFAVPGVVMRLAGTVTVTCVFETVVGVSVVVPAPCHCTEVHAAQHGGEK